MMWEWAAFRPYFILLVFLWVYVGLAWGKIGRLKLDRTTIVLLGAIALLTTGAFSLDKALQAVDFPSLLILFGLMCISSQLQWAGFYKQIAKRVAFRLEHPNRFVFLLIPSTGFLSSIINNDVVCLAFTPLVTHALLMKKINPKPYLIGLALASNIGCGLTLIGNAQSVVIGELAGLTFSQYARWAFVPVFLSLLLTVGITLLFIKKYDAKFEVESKGREPVVRYSLPLIRKGILVLLLLIMAYFTSFPRHLSTLIAAAVILVNTKISSKKILAGVDWQLLTLFVGLFILTGALYDIGAFEVTGRLLEQWGIDLKDRPTASVFTGVMGSLLNNAASFLLVVKLVNLNELGMGNIVALSNAFGGNFFLTSSVANLIVIQQARLYKVRISFKEFMQMGIPVTVGSFLLLLLWIKWIG